MTARRADLVDEHSARSHVTHNRTQRQTTSGHSAESARKEKYSLELVRYDRHLSAFPPVFISSRLA